MFLKSITTVLVVPICLALASIKEASAHAVLNQHNHKAKHQKAGTSPKLHPVLAPDTATEMSLVDAEAIEDYERTEFEEQTQLLTFQAFERVFELRMEPNTTLMGSLEHISIQGERIDAQGDDFAIPYLGHVAGDPNSWVRITFINEEPVGLVYTKNSLYELRNNGDGLAIFPSTLPPHIRRAADDDSPNCAAGRSLKNPQWYAEEDDTEEKETLSIRDDSDQAPLLDECLLVPIAIVGDFTFVNHHGGTDGAMNRITNLMNELDGAYKNAINTGFRVVSTDLYPDQGGPDWNNGGNNNPQITQLIMQLQGWKPTAEEPVKSAGILHLFTSRYSVGGFGAAALGVAYHRVLCADMGFSTGLSSDTGNTGWLVAAHEIGHNFGAPHDGDVADGPAGLSDCRGEGGGRIMEARVGGGASEFSNCSKNEMNIHLQEILDRKQYYPGKMCLDPCEGCGNGIVEEGEECDDGNDFDNDDCTNECIDPNKPDPEPDPDPSDTTGAETDPTTAGNDDDSTPDDDGGTDDGADDQGSGTGGGMGASDTDDDSLDTTDPTDGANAEGGFETGETGIGQDGDSSSAGCSVQGTKENRNPPLLLGLVTLFAFVLRRRRG